MKKVFFFQHVEINLAQMLPLDFTHFEVFC